MSYMPPHMTDASFAKANPPAAPGSGCSEAISPDFLLLILVDLQQHSNPPWALDGPWSHYSLLNLTQ